MSWQIEMDVISGLSRLSSSVENGTSVFNVSGTDLCKFMLLIDKIEQEGYGGDQNILKLRVDDSSRCEGTNPGKLVEVLAPYIRQKCVLQELRKYPSCNGCYGYKKIMPGECQLLDKFVSDMSSVNTYSTPETCCSQLFKTSCCPQQLVDHFFHMLESFAVEKAPERFLADDLNNEENIMDRAAQIKADYVKLVSTLEAGGMSGCEKKPLRDHCTCVDCFPAPEPESEESENEESENDSDPEWCYQSKSDSIIQVNPLLAVKKETLDESLLETMTKYPKYASGIQLTDEEADNVMITNSFSMSSIKSVLDLLPHRYAGLQVPYFYVGEQHSLFAAHTEDGSLYAANYLHFGFSKVWITISPEFCDRLRNAIQFLKMELAHTSCVNSLSHKYFFFTTDFLKKHSIPYHITIQNEGEFVILKPNTVHFGFNCGPCVSEAVNFGTCSWIPEGFKAQQKWRCRCYLDDVIHVDVTDLVAAFYPHLLQTASELSLVETQRGDMNVPQVDGGEGSSQVNTNKSKSSKVHTQKLKKPQKNFTCPKCNENFVAHKSRLLKHVRTLHSEDEDNILLDIEKRYPTKEISTTSGLVCPVCFKFFSGSSTHLRTHLQRQIKNVTDETIRQKYVTAFAELDRSVKKRKRKVPTKTTET